MSDPTPTRTIPVREDCWTEEATATLVETWGNRYVELNRGNLRQKDWQEVADAVNARHGHSKKTFRTDIQCKNRVDTVKKKYKSEKARVSSSNGLLTSSWPFYDRLDELVGSTVSSEKKKKPISSSPPPLALPWTFRKTTPMSMPPTPMMTSTPSQTVILPQKRSVPVDDSYFRRNYSAVAAAAAADEDELEDEDDDDDDDSEGGSRSSGEREEKKEAADGIRKLARAIERFGEMYERVEAEKQRQIIELEKQRMQFAKDLEVQRMQMFMNTQVQLQKMKHSKRSGSSNDIYS